MKPLLSIMICGALIVLFDAKSAGTMSSPVMDCGVYISSVNAIVVPEIGLRISCGKPHRQDAPVIIEYYLPNNSEVLSLGGNPTVEKSEKHLVLRWDGLRNTEFSHYDVRFKITTPGFYKLYGKVSVGDIPEKRLREIGTALANGIQAYSRTDKRTQLYRQQFLNSPNEIRNMLGSNLGLDPEAYYVCVSNKSVRIEKWDFSTYWKRLKHQWGLKSK